MTFDPEQQAVLDDSAERLLVEAPPGSGKTRTAMLLAARDVDLGRIRSTQGVLVLTFSRNARSELQRHADDLLTREQRWRCEITNYHSFFWQKVWQYRTSLGLPLEVDIATEAQHERDLDAVLATVGARLPRRGAGRLRSDYARALEFGLSHGRPPRLTKPHPHNNEVAAELRALHRRTGACTTTTSPTTPGVSSMSRTRCAGSGATSTRS